MKTSMLPSLSLAGLLLLTAGCAAESGGAGTSAPQSTQTVVVTTTSPAAPSTASATGGPASTPAVNAPASTASSAGSAGSAGSASGSDQWTVPPGAFWYFATTDGKTSCGIDATGVQCDSIPNTWALPKDPSCQFRYGFGVGIRGGAVFIPCANDTAFNSAEVGGSGTEWHTDAMPTAQSPNGTTFAVLPPGVSVTSNSVSCHLEADTVKCSSGAAWFQSSSTTLKGTLPDPGMQR